MPPMDTVRPDEGQQRRLAVMMFLEYLIWGSWLPLLALYLGGVLGLLRRADRLDLRHAGDRVCGRAVLRRPNRRSHAVHREAAVGAASRRRHRDVRARLPDDVLVVLFRHARVSAGLHADDVADQRRGVPSRGRPAARLRQDPLVGHHRLDRGELAVRVHPRRQDRPRSECRAFQHLHRGGHRLDRPGGVLVDAPAYASRKIRGWRSARRCRRSSCCAIRRCSCCSWRR